MEKPIYTAMSNDDIKHIEHFLEAHKIKEIECLLPDMSGVARGKILPKDKFLSTIRNGTLRIPESIFLQTITGDYVDSEYIDEIEPDIILVPDAKTIRLVPWYNEPTAQVICDAISKDHKPIALAARQVLKNIVALFNDKGWKPVVAPELEFYLCKKNIDPDYRLEPPIGKSGRQETGRQSYGIDAVNEYDHLFEEIYAYCEQSAIDIDALIHEGGPAQVEINFNHGDPLELADQVFLFKRTVRQVALKHDIYATFMAKPHESQPGSAMHIHQSVVDLDTGVNIFSDSKRKDGVSKTFRYYIGGLQKYTPFIMPLIAPNVNSYRRISKSASVSTNISWGIENRTVSFRIPQSNPTNMRIENRIPGADANPYLAIAATLLCGYLGMTKKIKANDPVSKNALSYTRSSLPRHLLDALNRFKSNTDIRKVLTEDFVGVFYEVKAAEYEAYQNVISPWEREFLLLNV